MGNILLSLILNSIMVGLLLATIIYCLKLNRRIRELQDGKSELARIIREFDESTTRATQNINEIHTATNRISDNIQMKIDKANFLANDLDMLIERGAKLTGKTDIGSGRSSSSRPMADAMPARVQPATAAETQADAPAARRPLRGRSRAEQELLSMLGGKKNNEAGS